MASEISPDLQNLLNRIVDNKLENYVVEEEESTLKGDNYLGDIIFLSLQSKINKEKLFLVVKKALEALKNLENFEDVYSNEIRFYEVIWPELDKWQRKHSLEFDKIPKCYGCLSEKGNEHIALEDIRPKGFLLHDKTVPLTGEHYRLIFRTYGVFHGISYAFREENPEEFRKITDKLEMDESQDQKNKNMSGFAQFLKLHLRNAIDMLEEKDIGAKKVLEKHFEDPVKYFRTETKYTGDTPVLVHGDCWSNNFMFKYNDKKEIEDMRFLDFQLIRSGTPIHDLSYCLYSGAPKELLDKLYDYLKIYYDSFTATLEKLECKPAKPYTFEMLKDDWKKYCTFGFYMALVLWRLKLGDKKHLPKVGSFKMELQPIAEDNREDYEKLIKDLVMHMYDNSFIS